MIGEKIAQVGDTAQVPGRICTLKLELKTMRLIRPSLSEQNHSLPLRCMITAKLGIISSTVFSKRMTDN